MGIKGSRPVGQVKDGQTQSGGLKIKRALSNDLEKTQEKEKRRSLDDEVISPHINLQRGIIQAPIVPMFNPAIGTLPGFLIPPPQIPSSKQLSSNSATTTSGGRWLTIQQIQMLPIQRQRKYWKWYFLEFCESQEATTLHSLYNSNISSKSEKSSPISIIQVLNPHSKFKLFSLLNTMNPQVRNQILQKCKQSVVISNNINKMPKQLQNNKLKQTFQFANCREDNMIYQNIQDENVFRQTYSVDLPDNSEMSEVDVE